jgi:drug/metabolite transporter (DMT)-like permease
MKMLHDQTKAIALILTAFALYSVCDATVKHLATRYPVSQIAGINAAFALLVPVAFAMRRREWGLFRANYPKTHLMRGLLSGISTIFAFYSFQHLPLANVYAMIFLTPVMVTLLSVLLHKEKVSAIRWCAISAGFLGVLIVTRPGLQPLSWPVLAGFAFPFLSSASILLLRSLRGQEHPLTTSMYQLGYIVLVSGIGMAGHFVMPTLTDFVVQGLIGIFCAGVGMLCFTQAYSLAPPATIAPFQYSQMLWGVLYGYLFFGNVPDLWLVVGGGLIIGAGLQILHHERRLRFA